MTEEFEKERKRMEAGSFCVPKWRPVGDLKRILANRGEPKKASSARLIPIPTNLSLHFSV